MGSSPPALEPTDLALLDRLATRLVDLRLEVPAVLALESGKPLSLLAGQTLLFFEPIVQSLFRFDDYRRFAALVERRDALEVLTRQIEAKADEAHARRRAARAAARRGQNPGP